MPNHDLARWQDEAEERAAEQAANRCPQHPQYMGDERPAGFCTRCLLIYVTRTADQYSRMEFAILRASR